MYVLKLRFEEKVRQLGCLPALKSGVAIKVRSSFSAEKNQLAPAGIPATENKGTSVPWISLNRERFNDTYPNEGPQTAASYF